MTIRIEEWEKMIPLHIDEGCTDWFLCALDFAAKSGLIDQLMGKLAYLREPARWNTEEDKRLCIRRRIVLYRDFAPWSFTWCEQARIAYCGEWKRDGLYGGLIYQGPGCPADGSFPSFTVSLDDKSVGWFVHT